MYFRFGRRAFRCVYVLLFRGFMLVCLNVTFVYVKSPRFRICKCGFV